MTLRSIIQNMAYLVLDVGRLTQFGEPYAPITGDIVLPKHPYELLREGTIRPNTKITIEYAQHEGEMFIESVAYPLDPQLLTERESRVPLKLWEYGV